MKSVRFGTPAWDRYRASLPRAAGSSPAVEGTVQDILHQVRKEGDRALLRLTRRFDGVRLRISELRVPAREIKAQARSADRAVVKALRGMAERVEAYHRRQRESGFRMRLPGGSVLEERVGPIDSAGLYVPGGAGAYPSSVLMNAIPARVAGVGRIQVTTPPRTLAENPAVAAALVLVGLEGSVFRVGGAQAIAALAYGTETIPAVAKIVGPGNAYVATAKRLLRGRVEVDQEAGPSEVVVLADDTADPGFVAADLLAQAEHGSGEETVVLVTTSEGLGREVARLIALGRESVANAATVRRALSRYGAIVLVKNRREGVAAVNALAPEHVEVLAAGAERLSRELVAGAVFIGPFAPVAVGDYGIGPNHVLPTGGAARFSSPLSVRDFQRRQSAVRMTRAGLAAVTEGMVRLAVAEGFRGHAQSLLTRFEG